MNTSNKHTWIIGILAAIVIVLFIVVISTRNDADQSITAATSTSDMYGTTTANAGSELQSPSGSASSVIASANMSARATVSTSTNGNTASKTQPVQQVSQIGAIVACDASMLDGSASWQSQSSSLTGVAKITNRGAASCRLSGYPTVYLGSGSGFLGTGQINQGSQGSVTLAPKQNAYVSFTWSNWCNQASAAPTRVRVVMPGTNTYLELPFIDSLGRAQAFIPACNSATASSIVTVNSFSI